MAAARILVIGDTLLNQTIRAEPALLGRLGVPAAFLNEELLHLRGAPDWSIQGVGYVARYLAEARPQRRVALLTETRNAIYPGLMRQLLTGIGDEPSSIYALEDRSAPVITRILRDVAASRSMGPQPDYRPQLRIDTAPRPLPPQLGRGRSLESALDVAFEPLSAGDRCLLRVSSPQLLGGYGEDPTARAKVAVDRVLAHAHARGVQIVVDLRPLPADLDVRDPETVICTTIGRLGDAFRPGEAAAAGAGADARDQDPEALVTEALWRLSPARAVVCFGAEQGVWVALRGELRSRGELCRIPITWPSGQGDGCGMVIGGDVFVAALVDALDRGADPVAAAGEAAAALCVAQGRALGEPIEPESVAQALSQIPAATRAEIHDPAGEPVLRLAASLADGLASPMLGAMVAPEGGRMRDYFLSLRAIFEGWRSRPGRDLVAIFGESRSGKEYPLKVALRELGLDIVGPVNMHQFLAETGGVIRELRERSAQAGRPLVLVLDEVVPDDASRSLLNLTAEKVYRNYATGEELCFKDNPVVLLSSIEPTRLLRDMQGRLLASVSVPPLRVRQDEIPYLLPMILGEGLGELVGEAAAQVQSVRVPLRTMAALLAHDYRPAWGAPPGYGLDQQNFRALADLVIYLLAIALKRDPEAAQLTLPASDLPPPLQPLAPRSLDDAGDAFVYTPPYDRPGAPSLQTSK